MPLERGNTHRPVHRLRTQNRKGMRARHIALFHHLGKSSRLAICGVKHGCIGSERRGIDRPCLENESHKRS